MGIIKFIFKTIFLLVFTFVALSFLGVLVYSKLPVFVTPLMVIRAIEGNDDLGWRWKHEWVPLEKMSKYMPVAVIASEDQNFLKHKGFDVEAIKAAYKEAKAGGRVRGGSTISQQTAKNVFLWPESSWIRKGFETYFTFLIEKCWSKQRIMEVYLNSIEMGPGIYGVEAVAKEHFNQSAEGLRRRDCALIAATLPNPIKYSSKHPSLYMLKRRHQIEVQMRHIDVLPLMEDNAK